MNASLWIMAATWENEHNSNIASARILLQRALRLMPENQQLWHEYFRLELIYIEKIKLRRRVLGITDEDEEMPQAVIENENTINLPAVTGEEADAWKEDGEEKKKTVLTDQKISKLEEANNPILQGLLARITYDNAIEAIPNDIEFRQRFVDIYREFTETEKDIQYVYDTIRRDLNQSPAARAFLAERNLYVLEKTEKKGKKAQYISCNDPAFIPAFRACVAEFETAIQELAVTEMWELYVKCLMNWYSIVTEENLKLYLSKLLQKTFKTCQKKNTLSANLYESWVSFAIQTKENVEKIDVIAQQGLDKFPQSVQLWIHRVKLGQEDPLKLYRNALDANPESLTLWTSYKDWILEQSQLDTETINNLFFKACEKATALLPSVTSDSADRNGIKELLQSSYVQWAAQSQGIIKARTVYKLIIHQFYPTHPFFMTCIQIENEYGDAKTGPKFVEYLYERATRLPEDKEGTYIAYLAYLYSQKKFQLANTVYTRASNEVSDKEAFDIRVQQLKASYTTTL